MSGIVPYSGNYYPNYYILGLLPAQSPASNTLSSQALLLSQQVSYMNSWNKQLSANMPSTLIALNSSASNLLQASKPFDLASSSNVFKQTIATSSTPNITAKSQLGATSATYNISVSQIATAQQNIGSSLTSNAASTLAPGTYSFNIQSNSKSYSVSFAVTAGDTNQTVLANMSKAISSSGAPVTASVNNNTTLGTSNLVINANNTGTNNSFTLTDVTGTAVAYTGANTIQTASANALYSINGVSNTSQSNTVYTDNQKLSFTFSGTATNATVTVSPDTQSISSAINNFVTNYNNLMTFARQNQQYISPVVSSRLQQSYQYRAADLKSIGITQNSDMTLSVDQTKLNDALKNNFGLVQSAFSGVNGIAVNTSQLARSISTSPLTAYANPLSLMQNSYSTIYNSLGKLNNLYLFSQLLPAGGLLSASI